MGGLWKKATVFLLVLVLVAGFGFGCGKGGEGKVTIKIGLISDLTGAAQASAGPCYNANQDVIRYYNDQGLIPGVKVQLVIYDCATDPARDLPGYYWLKDRGAKMIMALLPWTAVTLKPFGERDKVPIIAFTNAEALRVPPGWVFCFTPSISEQARTILNWVSENDWKEEQPAKLGVFQWRDQSSLEVSQAIKDWCQAHSDKLEYVGAVTPPVGSLLFGRAETEPLKSCDYVYLFATPAPYFMKTYREAGYTARFLGDSSVSSFINVATQLVGWNGLNGTLTTEVEYWWDESDGTIRLSKELIQRYRPGQTGELYSGPYKGVVTITERILQTLQAAVKEVGAENFDGQAFYNACLTTKVHIEGYPDSSFSETERDNTDYVKIYEWETEGEHLVSRSDWIPLMGQ